MNATAAEKSIKGRVHAVKNSLHRPREHRGPLLPRKTSALRNPYQRAEGAYERFVSRTLQTARDERIRLTARLRRIS